MCVCMCLFARTCTQTYERGFALVCVCVSLRMDAYTLGEVSVPGQIGRE